MSNPSYTGMDVTLPNPNDIDTFVHPPDVATIATVADGGSTGSDASSDTTGTGTSVSDNDDVDEPYNDPTMTLTERRAFNIERNHKLLSSLGMLNNETMVKGGGRHKIKQSRKYSSCNNTEPVDGVPSSTQETTTTTMIRGMIIPSCWSMDPLQRQRPQQQPRPKLPEPTPSQSVTSVASSLLLQLQRRYPHRSTQVRKLYSLISVPIHSIQHTTADNTGNAPHLPFVPPPILVTGPAGCGKTSIVRDVVKLIASSSVRPELLVLHAYIDCTTLDHIHIEDFITAAYTQWYQQVPKRETASSSQQKHHPPSKTRGQISSLSRIKNYNQADEAPKRISRNRQAKATTVSSSTSLKISNNQQQYLSVKENQGQEMESSSMSQPSSVLTAIWTFGRSLQRFLDRIHRDHPKITVVPLILIVDHAEVLLNMGTTYSKSSPGDRVNFLVQLMLLPRALNLNLTLIFISKNILLEHTALNNVNAQGMIQGHICPITIHFPSYRKKSTFQSILLQDDMKSLIAGNNRLDASKTFHCKVYKSFLETLIQGLSDFTSDIKEYLRLGRGLWPLYITPILPENIANTIAGIHKVNVTKGKKSSSWNVTALEDDLLPILDQKFFPYLRHAMEHGLGVLSFDSSGILTTTDHNHEKSRSHSDDLPILAKYMLLAAYICHTNRQEKDRQLFSIERNGRKRRKTKEADNEEEMAYGITATGSQPDGPKTIRPRTFPMERLYSLYVSMVSLNTSNHNASSALDHVSVNNSMDHPEMLLSLGNIRFLETMTYLRDIGVLHDFPKRTSNEPIRFAQRSMWTTISNDEAQEIAKSIHFPLDRYIL